MTGPIVSIIIPTHDRPERLRQALISVQAQSFVDWEVIVVDDGTEPPLNDTVGSGFSDPRISFHRQPSRGPGPARQLGASLARGALLCFLDDDDLYLPHHLETIVRTYNECATRNQLIAVGMLRRSPDGSQFTERPYRSGFALAEYWRHPHSLLPFAIPRHLVETTPIHPQYVLIEDFEWLCRLLSKHPLRQLPTYSVVYVEHAQNRTNTLIDRHSLAQRESVIEDLYALPEISEAIGKGAYRRQLTHQQLHWTRQCVRQRRWGEVSYGWWRAVEGADWRSAREVAATLYLILRTCLR